MKDSGRGKEIPVFHSFKRFSRACLFGDRIEVAKLNMSAGVILYRLLSGTEGRHIVVLWFNENTSYEVRITMYRHDDTAGSAMP